MIFINICYIGAGAYFYNNLLYVVSANCADFGSSRSLQSLAYVLEPSLLKANQHLSLHSV